MRNKLLSDRTSNDINKQVERIMRGLGNPKPPLDLRQVRELLKLDLEYYSASDDDILRETFSRMKVASKQVIKRPTLIIDAIRKLDLKALYIPDQKRILIDQELPKLKHRWNEAHEISHEIIPWHGDMMQGDNEQTLSRLCHDQIENEANYGAGRLLFLGDIFAEEANDTPPCFRGIIGLRDRYKNTITSTLWRYIECMSPEKAMFAMITDHPHIPKNDFNPMQPCRHFIRSAKFAKEFNTANEILIYGQISNYCSYQKRGLIGEGELLIKNDNGDEFLFSCETFFNTYDALTIGHCIGEHNSTFTFSDIF